MCEGWIAAPVLENLVVTINGVGDLFVSRRGCGALEAGRKGGFKSGWFPKTPRVRLLPRVQDPRFTMKGLVEFFQDEFHHYAHDFRVLNGPLPVHTSVRSFRFFELPT